MATNQNNQGSYWASFFAANNTPAAHNAAQLPSQQQFYPPAQPTQPPQPLSPSQRARRVQSFEDAANTNLLRAHRDATSSRIMSLAAVPTPFSYHPSALPVAQAHMPSIPPPTHEDMMNNTLYRTAHEAVVEAQGKVSHYTGVRQKYHSAGNMVFATKANEAIKKWESSRIEAERQRDHQRRTLENASAAAPPPGIGNAIPGEFSDGEYLVTAVPTTLPTLSLRLSAHGHGLHRTYDAGALIPCRPVCLPHCSHPGRHTLGTLIPFYPSALRTGVICIAHTDTGASTPCCHLLPMRGSRPWRIPFWCS